MILDPNAISDIAEGEPRAAAAFSRTETIAIPVIILGGSALGSRGRGVEPNTKGGFTKASHCVGVLAIGEQTTFAYAAIRSLWSAGIATSTA